MKNFENLISALHGELKTIHEDFLAISDEIWSSVNHNDTARLDEAYAFKKEFNRLLKIYEESSDNLDKLICSYTGTPKKIKKSPCHGSIAFPEKREDDVKDDNKVMTQEEYMSIPHSITEDFKYKKPCAFSFQGEMHQDLVTWIDVYLEFCRTLNDKFPERFSSIIDSTSFASFKHNTCKHLFSHKDEGFIKSARLFEGCYVETNFSSNNIVKRLMDLLEYFELPLDSFVIYLRSDKTVTIA